MAYRIFKYKGRKYIGVTLGEYLGQFEVITTEPEVFKVPYEVIMDGDTIETPEFMRKKLNWFGALVHGCDGKVERRSEGMLERLKEHFVEAIAQDPFIPRDEFERLLSSKFNNELGYTIETLASILRDVLEIRIKKQFAMNVYLMKFISKARVLGWEDRRILDCEEFQSAARKCILKQGAVKIPKRLDGNYYEDRILADLVNGSLTHEINVKASSLLTGRGAIKTAQDVLRDLNI